MCSVHFIDSIAINSADRSNSLSDHVLISFLCGGGKVVQNRVQVTWFVHTGRFGPVTHLHIF